MKVLTYVGTIVCVLLTSACEKSEPRYVLGRPVKVFEGETVSIENNSISITASQINDSRCPKNVICVWPGYATVQLELSSATDTVRNVQLCTGGCNKASLDTAKAIQLNHLNYTVALKKIEREKEKNYVLVTVSPN